MAAMDFPPNPIQGQVYSNGSVSYTYNGYAWVGGAPSSSVFAPLLSPVFTGDPRAPTPTIGDNDTSIATTEFVIANAVKKGGDTMTGGLVLPAIAFPLGGGPAGPAGIFHNSNVFAMSGGANGFQWNNNANSAALMQLGNDGRLVIPLAMNGSTTYITAAVNIGYGSQFGIAIRPLHDGNFPIVFVNNADTLVGYIQTTAAATLFSTSSDGRLKEDLQTFDAGNIIDNTNVYDFAWKSTGERAYGVIAQEANEVYPLAVGHMEEQDTWGIDYSKYVPVILQELKSTRARTADLEARLKVLEQALARAQRR